MKILAIGITSIEGDIKFLLSDYSADGNKSANLLEDTTRSLFFESEIVISRLYLKRYDNIVSYSLIDKNHIYTFYTDNEFYPYTSGNLNTIHYLLQTICDAHQSEQIHLCSDIIMLNDDQLKSIYIRRQHDKPAVQIERVSSERFTKLENNIKKIQAETSQMTLPMTFFAPKPTPVKTRSSFLDNVRWFFGLFSICSPCMSPSSPPKPEETRRVRY